MSILSLICAFILIGIFASRRKGMVDENTPIAERIRMNEQKLSETINQTVMSQIPDDDSQSHSGMPDFQSQDEIAEYTKNGIMRILTEIGCQPRINEEQDISFAYQGENFIVRCGSFFCLFYDPAWSSFNINDPYFPLFMNAVNEINSCPGAVIFLGESDQEGDFMIHSKFETMIEPDFKYMNMIIRSILNYFFLAKERLRVTFLRMKEEQEKKKNPGAPRFTSDEFDINNN